MISTLIYSSDSLISNTDPDFEFAIEKIRAESQLRNDREGITGFLFYFENKFVQILEGDFEPVTSLFASIRRDRRHSKPRIIWFSENEERAFDDWSLDSSMAYIAKNHREVSVKLSFLTRFISDTSQQHIKLRDLLVDIAQAMRRRREFPMPRRVA
ncbi:BLUF domain containing protein [Rhabdaerophilaceae bacterium]